MSKQGGGGEGKGVKSGEGGEEGVGEGVGERGGREGARLGAAGKGGTGRQQCCLAPEFVGKRTFCKCPMRLPNSFFDLLRASSLSSAAGGLPSCNIQKSNGLADLST